MVSKKSNVLDKPVGHKTSTTVGPAGISPGSSSGGGGGAAPVSADIDVKKLTVILHQ